MASSALDPTPANVAATRAVVAAAFADDPMMYWIFPDEVQREPAMAAWLGLFVEAFAGGGVVDVVHDDNGAIVGAALWRLGEQSLPFSLAPNVGSLLVAFLGPERAVELGQGLGAFAAHKPSPPFHYLQFLAVHPAHQGRGLGRRLVADGQQRAAAAGVGAYLESTNPRNLPFYRSLGFREIGEFTLEPAGPPVFRLWWSP